MCRLDRQCEREHGPFWIDALRPEPTIVRFHYGAADCKAHSHTALLAREERLEDAVGLGDPFAVVADLNQDHFVPVPVGADHEWFRQPVIRSHRVDAIADQIDQNLLHLDTIGGNRRQSRVEIGLDNDALGIDQVHQQPVHLVNNFIEVGHRPGQGRLPEQGPYPANHVRRVHGAPHDPLCGASGHVEIWRFRRQAALADLAVGNDGGQGLIDLVRNRRG